MFMQFTPAALSHLTKCLDKNNAVAIKFAMEKDGCAGFGYVVDFIKQIEPSCFRFQVSNLTIVIADDSIDLLRDVKVDYVSQSLGQKQLVFNNPQVTSSCGCGLSVSVKKIDDGG